MAVFITACGKDYVEIGGCEWKMTSVTNLENKNVENSVGDIVLVADDGELTLSDKESGAIYNGAYEEMIVTENEDDYKIYLDGKEGYATITKDQTLIITVDGYDLYFSVK